MAIDHTLLRMFMKMQERHAISGKIVTIGVQDVMFNHESAEEFFKGENYKFTPIKQAERTYRKSKAQTIYEGIFNVNNPMHMHDLFKMMNFSEVASLDAFDADNPTILHDMNKPIPAQYEGKYDTVFDIGSMEHVFDVKHFVANCIAMLKEGGTLMIYDALLGWHNECFYNFQTPFFFDVFKLNGFEDISVYLNYFPKYHDFGDRKTTWLRFEYGDRVQFRKKNYNTHVLLVAKRAKALPQFLVPMQGYYQEYYNDWNAAQAGGKDAKPELSHYMLENMPVIVRKLFPMLVPIYRMLPNWLRTPVVDALIYLRNRKKLAAREKIRC
jgi:hypothetical protein